MHDFPPNSQKAKAADPPREKLQPVTSAETVRRKRGLGRQFKETFFRGSPREAAGSMVEEIVVPAIRETLFDALQNGLNHLIFGQRASGRPRNSGMISNQDVGRVNYSSMSSQPKTVPPRMLSSKARARHDFGEVIIPSRQEADEVLERMYDVLSQYGEVSVAQLYALTGIRSEHTDQKWGWTSLRGTKAIKQRNGGFLLDLPKPEALG